MAGFLARGSILAIGNGVAGTPATITGIAVAGGVATVTATAHGFADGEIISIASVVGTVADWVNGRDHILRVVDANSFTLSTYVEGTYTSGGTATPQNTAFQTIGRITSFRYAFRGDRIDLTTIDDPVGYRTKGVGMLDGTFDMSLRYNPNLAAHGAINGLQRFADARVERHYRVSMPHISTVAPIDAFKGILAEMENTFDQEGSIDMTASGEVTGPIMRLPGS